MQSWGTFKEVQPLNQHYWLTTTLEEKTEIWTLKPDQTSLISSEDPPQMFAQKVETLPLPPSSASDPQSSSSRSPLIIGVLEW